MLPPTLVFQAERRERTVCFLLLHTVIAWWGSSVCRFSPVSYTECFLHYSLSLGQETWFCPVPGPARMGSWSIKPPQVQQTHGQQKEDAEKDTAAAAAAEEEARPYQGFTKHQQD